MGNPLVTVAIPSRNKSDFLRKAIESVLAQTFTEYKLIIIDNNSEISIKDIIEEFSDARISYYHIDSAEYNGIIGGWNKAISLCDTKYLNIFHDDDYMLPGFLKRSISVLENNDKIAFSFPNLFKADQNLKPLELWSKVHPEEGLISGQDYLKYIFNHECCITLSPSVVMRHNIYKKVGEFKDFLCFNSFDFNMWLRIAKDFDVYCIEEPLMLWRVHEGQMSNEYWWSHKKAKGKIATMVEMLYALSYLKNADAEYIKGKSASFSKSLSEHTRFLIKDL
ncbi:MAG: glycosyltransferase [Candidatus Zambryskibacteria bacterium]|nr:glycosyltransferase [Candidatus Zambryskibacteria bacterium]